MLKSDLLESINQGEGAKLEFKRDDIRPEALAKEIVAFANMNGGRILLGVEDDGAISGVSRENLQEWIMDTAVKRYVSPFILPDYEEVLVDDARVAVLSIPRGTAKPYVLSHKDREDIYVRYGSTSQRAGREQIARLFHSGGLLSAEELPVYGAPISELDKRRYVEYFREVLKEAPVEDWRDMLVNRSFLVGDDSPDNCSIFAYVLFAKQPGLRLPQAVVRLTVYPGEDKDYDTDFDKTIDAPFLEFRGEHSSNDVIEPALHERLMDLVKPYISEDKLSNGTRKREWHYPEEVIRELVVNALTHRDWTKQNYIRLVVYSSRLEVTSPGALPNGMTIEKIRGGAQASRNPKLVRIFREYGYLEDQGIGIRRKVIPLMLKHTGREPEFEATEDHFKVTLWKNPQN